VKPAQAGEKVIAARIITENGEILLNGQGSALGVTQVYAA
jgi:hypothetical protein